MTENDALIESRLDEELGNLVRAGTRVDQVRAADHIRELVSWRSPEYIAQLERQKGLR